MTLFHVLAFSCNTPVQLALAPSILMKRRADLTQLRQRLQQPRSSDTGTTFVRFPPQYTFYTLTTITSYTS